LKTLNALSLLTILCLVGCSSSLDSRDQCGTVSSFLAPQPEHDLYRAVVTHLDGKPVISQPNYRLKVGKHRFVLAELIDSPDLNVSLAAHGTKVLIVNVEANTRYHLAAKFKRDKRYRGNERNFWQPVVVEQEAYECQLSEKSGE